MKVNVYNEIIFSTARSGGKGGQNVNKVETMVEGRWNVAGSNLFNDEQKARIFEKLANKITSEGFLLVKSQTARTQLSNKDDVVRKINFLIEHALEKKKTRIATKPSKASKEKRVQSKKSKSKIKDNRRKVRLHDI
ncbi:alternative ribosome rescue aminoacyl-tRNA hydrolase ArfB [Segetibacter koreensis]|uniref:alternative ribosome rescue aminoacyl-tRNA hydrolase ArfB n=1 Tax=Segetibacter koreensis TaxID=398037 RepID=UPI0003713AA1|nr:alternative ribosome rescue aminoacyl-tRNA hydrolase ArfB [Segetibacter koreensis]